MKPHFIACSALFLAGTWALAAAAQTTGQQRYEQGLRYYESCQASGGCGGQSDYGPSSDPIGDAFGQIFADILSDALGLNDIVPEAQVPSIWERTPGALTAPNDSLWLSIGRFSQPNEAISFAQRWMNENPDHPLAYVLRDGAGFYMVVLDRIILGPSETEEDVIAIHAEILGIDSRSVELTSGSTFTDIVWMKRLALELAQQEWDRAGIRADRMWMLPQESGTTGARMESRPDLGKALVWEFPAQRIPFSNEGCAASPKDGTVWCLGIVIGGDEAWVGYIKREHLTRG